MSTPASPGSELSHVTPPGPRLPLLGALVGPGRDPLAMFTRFSRQYGDVTFFRLGTERCYFINHPDLVRDVLVTHQRNFTKSRGLERAKKMLGDGLLTAEGATHLRHRRLLQPAFHRDKISGYGQVMIDYAARESARWQHGETTDIARAMMRTTLAIAGKTLFDTDIASSADEVGVAVTEVLESFWLNLLPGADFLEKLPIRKLRRAHAARERLDALIFEMIAARRAGAGDRGDLLSMLVSSAEDPDREGERTNDTGLSDQEVRDEAMTILLAGHETTANALMWALYLLAKHPEADAKLHGEIMRVTGGRPLVPADYSQLTFTRRVVMEAMRLFPPAWIIGRRAIAEYAVGPYCLPARGMLFMSPYVMHRDPRFYAEAERFDPDRWTDEFIARLPKFAYFPFGGGTRICIGEQFAWMEAVLVLATVASRWRFAVDPGHRVVPQPLITLRSRYGMRLQPLLREGVAPAEP